MEKRIGVVGLTSNRNIGDYLLVEACSFLLENANTPIELVQIDADPQDQQSYTGLRRVNLRIFKTLRRRSTQTFAVIRSEHFQYAYRYFYWWIKVNWHYRKMIKELDGLIIAGGGFIKFKTQGLNFFVEQILALAAKKSIPVMFNAVGIEGFDQDDLRCRRLKRALNSGAVRVITTRDDLETLTHGYVDNSEIVTATVGDPVFWLDEMYPSLRRPEEGAGVIGLNLINPNNFSTYGGTLTAAQVANFYKNLIEQLDLLGAQYRLFSNGMVVDQKFGQELVSSMNLPAGTLLRRPKTSDEFIEMYKNFNIILAARMHAGITAYALEIPFVGLIWSEKIEFFATQADIQDRFFGQDHLDYRNIAKMLVDQSLSPPPRERRMSSRDATRRHLENFIEQL